MAEITELFQGKVTHVIDPYNFYAQIGTETDIYSFQQLVKELNTFCDFVGVFNHDSDFGDIDRGCYILVNQDRVWLRAQIARVNHNNRSMDVVYLDNGDTDNVLYNQICLACPQIFYSLKPQAVKCQIAGIKPLAKNWTSRGIKCFKEKTKDVLFQMAIVFVDPHFLYQEVSLYYSDEEGRSLAFVLMDEEIGMPSDVLVPEFARDVKSVLPESYLETFHYDTDETSTIYSENCSPLSFEQPLTAASTDDQSNPTSYINRPADLFSSSQQTYSTNNNISKHFTSNSQNECSAPECSNQDSRSVEETIVVVNSSNNHSLSVNSSTTQLPSETTYNHTLSNEDESTTLGELPTDQTTPTKLYTDAWSDLQSFKPKEGQSPGVAKSPSIGHSEPTSPEVAIPSFNISTIMQTKTVCAGDLQEERDVKRRVTTKTKMVDNIERIHSDMEYQEDMNIPREWGMSDLNIGAASHPVHDVYDNIKSQIEAIQPKPQYMQTGWEQDGYGRSTEDRRSKPLIKLHNSPEAEYKFSKKLEKVLVNIKEDPAVICEEVHKLVPPVDGSCEENVLSVCLETILRQSVTNKTNQNVLLTILDTYSTCENFAQCLESVINKLNLTYIKRPIRKTLHTDFTHILAQLLFMSTYWPDRCAKQTKDLIINMVEKWIVFNASGRPGRDIRVEETSEMYLSCLETMWPVIVNILSLDKHQSFLGYLETRLLMDGIRRHTRKRLFDIYLMKREDTSTSSQTDKSLETALESIVTDVKLQSESTTQTSTLEQDTQSTQTDSENLEHSMKETSLDTEEIDVKCAVDYDVSDFMFDEDEDEVEELETNARPVAADVVEIVERKEENSTIQSEIEVTPSARSFADIRKFEPYNSDGCSSSSSISSSISHNKRHENDLGRYDRRVPSTNKLSDFIRIETSTIVADKKQNIQVSNPTFDTFKKLDTKSTKKDHTKSTKSHKHDKKNYNSWAECVKKEKSTTETTLQSDHLKHLALQTLKSGILKGKNIQPRSQLSAQDLLKNTHRSQIVCEDAYFPVLSKNTSHEKPAKSVPSVNTTQLPGKFLPLKKSPNHQETKKKRKESHVKVKLTREEQLENEILKKFALKPLSQHSETEFPSLKNAIVKPTKDSNSLLSIASDILYGNTTSEQSISDNGELCDMTTSKDSVENVQKITSTDDSIQGKGETSTTTSCSYFDDSDDEWESDDSEVGFIVSGPADIKTDPTPRSEEKRPKFTFPVEQEKSWNPKVRTCTSCGETTHLVYDCPSKTSIFF